MGSFSLFHWVIVLLVVMLLFGGGRISSMMGDVAKGIKSFRKGLADDEDDQPVKRPVQSLESGTSRTIEGSSSSVGEDRTPR